MMEPHNEECLNTLRWLKFQNTKVKESKKTMSDYHFDYEKALQYAMQESHLHKMRDAYVAAAKKHEENVPDTAHDEAEHAVTSFYNKLPKHLQDAVKANPDKSGHNLYLSRNHEAGFEAPQWPQYHDAFHKVAKAMGSHSLGE